MKKLLFALLILSACQKKDKERSISLRSTGTGTHIYIVYYINGVKAEVNGAKSPWKYDFTGKVGDVIEVTANAQGNEVSASIFVDDIQVGSCNDSGGSPNCKATTTVK